MATRKPAHEVKLGKIRAAIWANGNGHDEVWFNVTVTRLYKDEEGWKDSSAFRRDDLPIVSKVMDMAFAWIWDRQAMTAESEETEL